MVREKFCLLTYLKTRVATGSGPNSARTDESGRPPQESSLFGERPTRRCGILLMVRSIVRLGTAVLGREGDQ